MNKEDLKIGIISNKFLTFKISTALKQAGFKNIYTKNLNLENLDILIIDEEKLESFKPPHTLYVIPLVSFFSNKKDAILKSANKEEIINIVVKVANVKLKNKKVTMQLTKTISYKNYQEQITLNKQLKIIKDNVNGKKFNDLAVNIYFQPKDIVSGDSYFAIYLNDRFFFLIVDAMGKGLSAGVSAMLSVSFISYLFDTLKYSFKEFVKRSVNYIKTILLEDEGLCLNFIEIKDNRIKYANFAMPPIYINKKNKITKIRPNNTPITIHSQQFNIDTIFLEYDGLYILSDGILESITKEGTPLFLKFKKILEQNFYLNEIKKELNNQITSITDDTTIIALTKDIFFYKKIFEREYFYSKREIDSIIKEIESITNNKKLSAILLEVLLLFKSYVKIIIYKNSLYLKVSIEFKEILLDISEIFKYKSNTSFIIINNLADNFIIEEKYLHIYLRRNR